MKITDLLRWAVPVFLILTLSIFSYANSGTAATRAGRSTAQAPSESLDVNSVNMQPATDGTADSTPVKLPNKPAPQDFSVKTWKSKKAVAHAVQLVSPPHHATYTPGVITFQWKLTLNTKKQKKFRFFIESHDGKTKIDRKTNNEKRLMSIGPGQYRWRVVADTPKADSRWRSFKVIKLKSEEMTRLYEGRSNRRPTAEGMTHFSEAIVVDEGDPAAEGEPDNAAAPTAPVAKTRKVTPTQSSRLAAPGSRAPASIDLGDAPPATAQPKTATGPAPSSSANAKNLKLKSSLPTTKAQASSGARALPAKTEVTKTSPNPTDSVNSTDPAPVDGVQTASTLQPTSGITVGVPVKAAPPVKSVAKQKLKAAAKKIQANATSKTPTSVAPSAPNTSESDSTERAPASVEPATPPAAPGTVKFLTPKSKTSKDSLNFD